MPEVARRSARSCVSGVGKLLFQLGLEETPPSFLGKGSFERLPQGDVDIRG